MTFDEAVKEAKTLLPKPGYQLEIAKIALEVVELSWGGSAGRGHTGEVTDRMTIKRFAKAIGVHPNTLSTWMVVQKAVVEKIPKEERSNYNFSECRAAATRLGSNVSSSEVKKQLLFQKENPDLVKIRSYLAGDVRSLLHHLDKKSGCMTADKKTLEEVLFYCNKIRNSILSAKRGIKAKNNNIATSQHRGNIGVPVAGACGITRNITLKEKDQNILRYLAEKGDYASPTEISKKVGNKIVRAGGKTVRAEGRVRSGVDTAWSVRSLYKLKDGGMVKKNMYRHYAITPKGKRWLAKQATS